MLGSFSQYRGGIALPPKMSCYECCVLHQHYCTECPSRFVRVSGEAPLGWKVEHGTVVKDPDAWNGPELADAARA